MKDIIIEIPQYIREVQLSKARMKKYYKFGKNHPKAKKYEDTTKFEWRDDPQGRYLYDIEKNERVIANPKAAGTPNTVKINGQKIYNGSVNKHMRAKLIGAIKDSFAPYVEKIAPLPDEYYPLNIDIEIHDVIQEEGMTSLWDVDNRAWPYLKGMQDCLTGNADKKGKKRSKQIIIDDSCVFITNSANAKFIPVDKPEDRKIIFIIKKETDKRILNHEGFNEKLKQEIDDFRRVSKRNKQNVEKGRRSQRIGPLQARNSGRGR